MKHPHPRPGHAPAHPRRENTCHGRPPRQNPGAGGAAPRMAPEPAPKTLHVLCLVRSAHPGRARTTPCTCCGIDTRRSAARAGGGAPGRAARRLGVATGPILPPAEMRGTEGCSTLENLHDSSGRDHDGSFWEFGWVWEPWHDLRGRGMANRMRAGGRRVAASHTPWHHGRGCAPRKTPPHRRNSPADCLWVH